MTPSGSSLGVFDSGIGGLSILRELRRRLPARDIDYFADQAHVPYGPRPMEEVRRFSEGIAAFLIERGSPLLVVACNTASAAALTSLRSRFPEIPIVGMEPAVKPAAETSRTGVVGVLATPATFQGELFASVVERFARGVRLINRTAPGLVERIEAGDLDGPETRRLLEQALEPIRREGADTLVLACTHYPFVIPLIQDIVGPEVRVIDPAPAIARQTERRLVEAGLSAGPAQGAGKLTLFSTGNASGLARMAMTLIGEQGESLEAVWEGDRPRLV
jgi:glutamate racemase